MQPTHGVADVVRKWVNLKTITLSIFTIECLLTSGIIFGWAPLSILLEREGAFHNSCGDEVSKVSFLVKIPKIRLTVVCRMIHVTSNLSTFTVSISVLLVAQANDS